MSQARVHTVNRANKDQGECESCGMKLPKGSSYRWFIVGFRSILKHRRCMDHKCNPSRAALESSNLGEVYALVDDFDAGSFEDLESLKDEMQNLSSQIAEIAQQYIDSAENPNTGVVFNTDANERGERLQEYAESIETWEPDDEEPTEEAWNELSKKQKKETGYTSWEDWHADWFAGAKESAQDVVDTQEF